MDIAEFIAARLDEDEAAARVILEDPDYAAGWHEQSSGVLYVGPGGEDHPLDGLQPLGDSRLSRHIARHDPARVLREVAAKRAILAAYAEVSYMDIADPEPEFAYGRAVGLGEAMRHLAATWSDHPDFDRALQR